MLAVRQHLHTELLFAMSHTHPSQCSSFEEYLAGQVLALNGQSDGDHAYASVIYVRIRRLHTRTFSCTMVVDILDEERPSASNGVAFLKIFDRRFSEGLRRDNGIEPWTKLMEQAYIESIESGTIHRFLHNLRCVDNFQEDTEEGWNDAENEAFLAHELLRQYDAEVGVYNALRDQQGERIPKLLAAIDLELATPGAIQNRGVCENFAPFRVKGILLEYLNGCSLFDIMNHFPRSSWQCIVDQAIATARILGDRNILNKDANPRNFLVCSGPDGRPEEHPRVFMIDFGLCRFRQPDESDAEWGRDKWSTDEEGAIALRMKKLLGKHGYELRYKQSLRYYEWADGEDSFP